PCRSRRRNTDTGCREAKAKGRWLVQVLPENCSVRGRAAGEFPHWRACAIRGRTTHTSRRALPSRPSLASVHRDSVKKCPTGLRLESRVCRPKYREWQSRADPVGRKKCVA